MNQIRVELSDNLVDSVGLRKIETTFNQINSKVNKIPLIFKMLLSLTDLKNKILSILQSSHLNNEGYSPEFYVHISELQDQVLELIDDIQDKGYDTTFKDRYNNIMFRFEKLEKT